MPFQKIPLFLEDLRARGLKRKSGIFFSGINAITSFYFTATGKALESAVISSSRGLVVLLLCIFTLPALFGMAVPVTEAATLIFTGFFLYRLVY